MRTRELKRYEKMLLDKKRELIAVVQKIENYGRELDGDNDAMDIADKASSSYTKEFMFSKSDSDRQLLQAVMDALSRIKDRSYGECDNCGETIERKRLQAVPWASLCIDCQQQAEQSR